MTRDRSSIYQKLYPNRRSFGPLWPPTPPASRRFQGGTATPFAPHHDGTASSFPKGEAVIVMHALRAIPLSGAFCGLSQYLMQQRRAVRATVREERYGAAGDEEPATKSRASTCHQARMKDQGDGASGTDRREWSRARSTVSHLQRTENQ